MKKSNFTRKELENSLYEHAKVQSRQYKNLAFVDKIFGKSPITEKVKNLIQKKSTKDTTVYKFLMKEGYASKYDHLTEYMDYRNEDSILYDMETMGSPDFNHPDFEPEEINSDESMYDLPTPESFEPTDDVIRTGSLFDESDDYFNLDSDYDDRTHIPDDESPYDEFYDDDYYDDEYDSDNYIQDYKNRSNPSPEDIMDDNPIDEEYIDEMCEECDDEKGYTHSDALYEEDDDDDLFESPQYTMPENWVIEKNNKSLRLTYNKKYMTESVFKTKIDRFQKMGYKVRAFKSKSLMEQYLRK